MTHPPSGNLTFLFTDIVGSTALWDEHPDEMTDALAEHDERIRSIVAARDGHIFTTAGDSFAVAFESPEAAIDAALAIQLAMRTPASGLDLPVRIGLHSGTATRRGDDYFGGPVNRAARVSASAHAHQVVTSQTTLEQLDPGRRATLDLIDLGIHRLRGLTEPTHLQQICHPDLPRDHPRLRTVEGPEDSLPVQLTSFVGRSTEVAEIRDLLHEHRMVTLAGAGGAGKTRLAVRVAERMVSDFPDGLRMAELGAIVDADVLADEIAQRFAVGPVAGQPLITTIAEYVGAKRILLVLDNCEQIVEPVAALCRDLLTRCPQLHVLATSRQRLGVTGEAVYRVPSLAMPDLDATSSQAMASDAVRLFADRARLADHSFEVNADNVADIIAICRRLDGIPLALELAAARLRSMSSAQIVRRLDQRFKLLTGSDHTSIRRQETLLSTIEWSHDLLDPNEQTLFRRLGVFAADFPLESAEAICAGADLDEFDVLELLATLVDKSMVTTEQARDGGTRYHILESIREFAQRRLEESGELAPLQDRHAEHYADNSEALQAMQRAGKLTEALIGLDADEDEFRSALRFTTATHRDELAGRLVSGLGYLWYAAGLHREGLEWCRALLESDPVLSDGTRAGVLHSYGSLLSGTGRPDVGITAYVEQVAIRRRLGDPLRLAAALNNLGNLLTDVGDVDAANEALGEAAELFQNAGDTGALALAHCSLAWGHLLRGVHDDAASSFREALKHARTDDSAMSIAVAMVGLGAALTYAGRSDEARPHLIEAKERFVEINASPGVIEADALLGLLARIDGDIESAARHLLASLDAPGQAWYDEVDFWTLQYAASILDDPSTAATLIGAATAAYEATKTEQIAFVHADLAATRSRLEAQLDPLDFGASFRAGTRRSKVEAVAIGKAGLEAIVAANDQHGASHDA